jgi:lipopolysaccharide/colanic/teichoic acid biosynthesis glycosyltransferase
VVHFPFDDGSDNAPVRARIMPAWKRALDLIVGSAALIVLGPVMLIVAGLVLATSGRPVLFRQSRVGRGEAPFTLFKFRTMRRNAAASVADREDFAREVRGEALPEAESNLFRPRDDSRITQIGHFLRRYSLDELPQILNVLRGEMSLVGPRPSVPWEVALFSPRQRRRHELPPGITGLWQVSGRNSISVRGMLELDLSYVESCSLRTDLSIILRTPRAVLLERLTR